MTNATSSVSRSIAFSRNACWILPGFLNSAVGMAPLAIDEESPATQDSLMDLNGHADNKRRNLTNEMSKPSSGSSIVPEALIPTPSCATTCLGDLQTEQENANTSDIDSMSSLDLCRMLYRVKSEQTM